MSRLRFARIWRWFLAAAMAIQGAAFALDLLQREWAQACLPLACAGLVAHVMRWNARTIAALEKRNRPRPDYARIATLEREIYGKDGS